MTVLTIQQAYDQALAAGFTPGPDGSAVIMAAIMMAESGLSTTATGYNPGPPCNICGQCASVDQGIGQINNLCHPEVSAACAYDPVCAIQSLYRISSGGTYFVPWTTYTGGAYLNYLPQVLAAIGAPGSTTPPPGPQPPGAPSDEGQPLPTPTSTRLPFSVWFENWKTGHLANERGLPLQNYLPNYFVFTDKVCPDNGTRETIPSWIKVNGRWFTPIGGPDKTYAFYDDNMLGRLVFGGTPNKGDEGLYAVGFSASKGIAVGTSTSVTFFITVTDPSKQDDAEIATTMLKMIRADIGERDGSEHFRDASQLHPVIPLMCYLDIQTLGNHDPFSQNPCPDFCSGIAPVLPYKPLDLPGHVPSQPDDSLCGAPFMSDIVAAANWHCQTNAISGGVSLVCGACGDTNLYLAFVAATANRVSNFNPSYQNGCHIGLFGVANNTCGGRFTTDQLLDPAFNFDAAAENLEAAFADTAPAFCGGKACPGDQWTPADRLSHAVAAYLTLSGLDPGAHGGPVGGLAVHSPFTACRPILSVPEADCYIKNIRGAPLTPGRDGGGGQPTPGGTGGSEGGTSGGGTAPGGGGDTSFTPGCPRKGVLTADCAWHWAQEGIPAIDIACNEGDFLFSPCDGIILYRGLDNFARPRGGLTGPNHLLGLGLETRIQCNSGLVVRFGHQKKFPLESFCPSSDGSVTEFLKDSWGSCQSSFCGAINAAKGCSACCNQDEDPNTTTMVRCQGCPSPGPQCVPCAGYSVKVGTIIGKCDSTGYSFGNHLHYETWVGGGPGTSGHRICPLETLPAGCP